MTKQRILAIGLDGYEESLERRFMAAGELPALARLRERSARYLLDHGPAQRSGLAWEHFSTGLAPERAGRWTALHFDPETYDVWQEGTRLVPFPARLNSRTVVFDAALVVFSMGGMGPSYSDTGGMALLPELMYRRAFGRTLLRQPDGWTDTAASPLLGEREEWSAAVRAHLPADESAPRERVEGRDPLTLGPTEADMVVVWRGTFCALEHSTLGRVGPLPFRRTGGHTGPFGMAYLTGDGVESGDRGVRSAFDVVPTLCDLLGEPPPEGLSGTSLLS